MSVIKIRPVTGFVTLLNEVLQDQNLSMEAIGLWAHCMSRPKDWVFHVSQLTKHFGVGEKKIYKSIKELIDNGYAFRGQIKEKREGTLAGNKAVFSKIEYIFFSQKIQDHEIEELKSQYVNCTFQINFKLGQNRHAQNGRAQKDGLQKKDSIHIKEEDKIMSEVQAPSDASFIAAENMEINNGIEKPYASKKIPEEAMEIAKHLLSRIREVHPKFKEPYLNKWSHTISLINRLDKKTWQEIKEMIQWAFDNDFWYAQIQSPEALRKHWDKMAIQRSSFTNKSILAQKNRQIAGEVKNHLNQYDKSKLLWIGSTVVTNNSTNESISLDLPTQTFEGILFKWFDIRRE